MRLTKRVAVLSAAVLISGCSAYNTEPKSIVLPTSNKSIDLIQHRSDVRLTDCATLVVLQTFDASGRMIDSKDARGNALHCTVLPALIEAGGRVGGAYVGRSPISIRSSQAQSQVGVNSNTNTNTNANTNTNTATGGQGGQGGQGGNNGGGNGDSDGTNNGTDNHNEGNGDNN